MKTRKRTIILCIAVGLCGFGILINGLFSKNTSKNDLEGQITIETSTSSTISTTTTKTTKKKTTKKKTTKKVVKKINIDTNKEEIINYAKRRVKESWGDGQWDSFYQLVQHESGWNPNSVNSKTGACGLFQFVPCSKGGANYKKDYRVQVDKGILYIKSRYGTPNNAWSFWQKHH